ncbi:MFS transporter [Alteromonas sp. MYP5]|uniref:MFS transporter n=1 Tax=Alteromonas ponticola TaxID=2720613 RepID=A0ABX1R5Y3_9ALTE|nr:MFS transporter [Alteromonas ponticola]
MTKEQPSLPYWRLSSFYFFNCAVLGAILPYWGLYMSSLSFAYAEIGIISAVLMASNIVAPYFWGWLCDHSGRRISIIRLGNFIAAVSFACLWMDDSFYTMVGLIFVCSFCWQGLNSQFEIITLNNLTGRVHVYSQIRLWGSVGFIAAVSALGWVFESQPLTYLPIIVLSLLLFMWVTTLLVGDRNASVRQQANTPITENIRNPLILGLIVSVTLIYLSHGTYYGFYSIYLAESGIDNSTIGMLWTLAVIAELICFAVMAKLFHRIGIRPLFLFSVVMTAVRWLGIGYLPESLVMLAACQLLHGLSFSVVHATVIELIRQHFGDHNQGRGQALYCSICVGLGQAVGVGLSGWLWDWSHAGTFYLSAAIALLAGAIAWRWVYPKTLESAI